MIDRLRFIAVAVMLCGILSACVADSVQSPPAPTTAAVADYQPVVESDQEVLNAQAQQMRKVEVTLTGRVFKMLPDDTRGLPHELWLMKLSNGTTVKIAHDTKLAPRVPLSEGDLLRLHGEYIWNEKGGVIHWTHHDPRGTHEPGWIDFNGQRYE